MKFDTLKLPANLIALQACLLLAGILLYFSVGKTSERLFNQHRSKAIVSNVKGRVVQRNASLGFSMLNSHKSLGNRVFSGKAKSFFWCLTGRCSYYVRQVHVAIVNTWSFLSWARPGYYLFLFIYTLF